MPLIVNIMISSFFPLVAYYLTFFVSKFQGFLSNSLSVITIWSRSGTHGYDGKKSFFVLIFFFNLLSLKLVRARDDSLVSNETQFNLLLRGKKWDMDWQNYHIQIIRKIVGLENILSKIDFKVITWKHYIKTLFYLKYFEQGINTSPPHSLPVSYKCKKVGAVAWHKGFITHWGIGAAMSCQCQKSSWNGWTSSGQMNLQKDMWTG